MRGRKKRLEREQTRQTWMCLREESDSEASQTTDFSFSDTPSHLTEAESHLLERLAFIAMKRYEGGEARARIEMASEQGNYLRQLRYTLNVQRTWLARKLGVTATSLLALETGALSITEARPLAKRVLRILRQIQQQQQETPVETPRQYALIPVVGFSHFSRTLFLFRERRAFE